MAVGFFKRLFSADYRAAVSAEASGDLELAAERYALAGQPDAAVRVHLARAARADSRADEITALRDALHWAAPEGPLRARVLRNLGTALLSRARAEGIATERDRARVREAATLLAEAGAHRQAGEAWELIGEEQRAIAAYGAGGLLDRMEQVLGREEERTRQRRALRQAFADYQMHMRTGDRDAACAELRTCLELADDTSEYRRLLDRLESRLITGGRALLRVRQGARVTVAAGGPMVLGRDPLGDLVLRSGGISRRHAEISAGATAAPFVLRDLGSRNGTLVGGMPVTGAVPLTERGRFQLGDQCELSYTVAGEPPVLDLRVEGGLDAGTIMLFGGPGARLPLAPVVELAAEVTFRDGRPLLAPAADSHVISLDGEPVTRGVVQLIHGDRLAVDGVEVDVE